MLKSINRPENLILLKWLREQREAKNLTMRDLGEKLNVPHSFIGKVEQGERRLDVIEFMQYCDAIGISSIEGINIILSKND